MARALFAVSLLVDRTFWSLGADINPVDAFTNSRSYVHQDMGACQQKPLSLPAASIGCSDFYPWVHNLFLEFVPKVWGQGILTTYGTPLNDSSNSIHQLDIEWSNHSPSSQKRMCIWSIHLESSQFWSPYCKLVSHRAMLYHAQYAKNMLDYSHIPLPKGLTRVRYLIASNWSASALHLIKPLPPLVAPFCVFASSLSVDSSAPFSICDNSNHSAKYFYSVGNENCNVDSVTHRQSIMLVTQKAWCFYFCNPCLDSDLQRIQQQVFSVVSWKPLLVLYGV